MPLFLFALARSFASQRLSGPYNRMQPGSRLTSANTLARPAPRQIKQDTKTFLSQVVLRFRRNRERCDTRENREQVSLDKPDVPPSQSITLLPSPRARTPSICIVHKLNHLVRLCCFYLLIYSSAVSLNSPSAICSMRGLVYTSPKPDFGLSFAFFECCYQRATRSPPMFFLPS